MYWSPIQQQQPPRQEAPSPRQPSSSRQNFSSLPPAPYSTSHGNTQEQQQQSQKRQVEMIPNITDKPGGFCNAVPEMSREQRMSTLGQAMIAEGADGDRAARSSGDASERDTSCPTDDTDSDGPAKKLALPSDEAQTRNNTNMVVAGTAVSAYNTTWAGQLLTWPTIHKRVLDLLNANGTDLSLEYSIQQMQHRGSVRLQDLDFSPSTVRKYAESYDENIQSRHPLMTPPELHALITTFLATLSTARTTQINRPWDPEPVDKRSLQPEGGSGNGSGSRPSAEPTWPSQPTQLHSSIENALVLLILALGKMCLHKHAHTPELVPEHDAEPPQPRSQSSPAATANYSPAASNASTHRNIDGIPGLEYFEAACDILSAGLGGCEIKHVWVFILACLYSGQRGRPRQSLNMVAIAGRYLQAVIQPSLHRYGQIRARQDHVSQLSAAATYERWTRDDIQCIFTFWTFVQLESDIRSHLPLPRTEISAYEQKIPYPDGNEALRHGFNENALKFFMAQVYLYKLRRAIHESKCSHIGHFALALQPRGWAPPGFQSWDRDSPASHILAARLRARYWGAQVVLYREFIRRILERNYRMRMRGEEAVVEDVNVPLAECGIQALVESTRASHSLSDWQCNTAHAQWGNLLILDSIQRDPVLGRFLGEDTINDLFRKTTALLEIVSQHSSALDGHLRILKGLFRGHSTTSPYRSRSSRRRNHCHHGRPYY